MSDPQSFTQILLMLAEALSPFMVALASYLAYQGAAWLKQKTKNERAGVAVDMALGAVSDIVFAGGAAFQAKLRAAAEDGVITKAEMIEIRDASLKAARAQAGTEAYEALKAITDDPDAWLWTKIRAEAAMTAPMIVAAEPAPAEADPELLR